ncbi:MAG: hypothetical protein IPN71_20170 [Fibrobacteres bacterium]|nr:hypothetical protein [Fibrobacterota bacterium]
MNGKPLPRLGVDELDDQHERMASMREEIRLLPTLSRAYPWLELLEEFRSHFCLESQMMVEDSFPDRRLHELDHERILAHMTRIGSDALEGLPIEDSELDSLERWMASHLLSADKSLVEFRLETELWKLREECQWDALELVGRK